MIKIDAKSFNEALEELEAKNGVSRETILHALKEAMEKGYKKHLGGDDALVRVEIDADKGTIEIGQEKKVVETVEDDFLEISLEDAKKLDKKYKLDDLVFYPASAEDITKATALSIKSVYKQKIAEAEKEALYEAYKDKIGEMITGKVEKVEENGLTVNIGKTSTFIPRKELIGDERFNAGDPIKLYVSDVSNGNKNAKIIVSRSNEGFLKRIFEEEIRDIYDGTVIIKSIARVAGERSKIAVYSNDPNVDASGSCIGPSGSKIQKIVTQLGNGSNKEKIDVIAYSDNIGLFIIDSLKPAAVLGVVLDKENKKALAIVGDGSLSLAIGKKGVNVKLASHLTGYSIDIKEASVALEEGIQYQSVEELERLDVEARQKAALEAAIKAKEEAAARLAKQEKEEKQPEGIPAGYVAPNERHYEDDISEEEKERLEDIIEEQEAEPVKEEVKVEAEEIKEEAKPVVETPKTVVKTTTTLEDLEKELASEAAKSKATQNRSRKKKKEEEKEEDSIITKVDPSQRMSIYTEEELKELEAEEQEEEYDDEDIDYDEYDDYYDDDNN